MLEQFQKLSLQSQDYLFSQLSDSELPKGLLDMAPMVKLDSLQISNFKSFGGDVYVGPFRGFTCLIGPNGSGKSNVLEAIMFCFCSENIKHSYFDLRDFIHRDGGGTQTFKELSKKGKRCTVSARLLLQDGNQLHLMRELDAESNEKFCINYDTVSRKVYENFLLRKGINPNTPNYAIWQGEVDRLILKQPLQLTNYFEQLSGSIMLKHTYEEIKNDLNDARKEIEYRTQRITKLKSQKRNMKAMKDNNHEYEKAEDNYNKIIEKVLTAKVYLKQLELKDLEKEIHLTSDKQAEKMKEVNEHKVKLQRQQKQKINLEKEMNQIMSEINQLNAELKIKNQPANILKQHKIHELRNQIIALEDAVNNKKQRRQALENSIPEIHSTDLTKEYLELYTQWQNENTASNQELHKKKTQLLYVEGLLQAKEAIVYEYKVKQENQQKHKEESKKQAQQLKQQIESIDDSVLKMRLELSKANELMKKGQKELMEKRAKLSQVNSNIEELEVLLTENAESVKQKEIIKRLSHIEGFKGLIEQRVKPISHKYEVCFGFLMGSISKHLICTSERVSKDVAAKLRQIGQLKTLLILQNIKSNKKTTNIRSNLGKLGIPALDVIDFDKGLQNLQIFLAQYLKGKVVCDNTSQAYQIRDKRISGVQEIHTLDGNIIRADGLVTSYGNTETLHKNYKYVSNSSVIYTDLAKYNEEKSKIETELQMLSEKYNEQSLLHRNQELALVEKKKEELQQKMSQLLKPKIKNNIQVPKALTSEMAELEKKKAKVVEGIKAIENKLESSDYFNEFMKKHSIQSLESFRKQMDNITFLEDAMKKKNSCNREINDLTAEINQIKEQIQSKVDLLQHEEDSVKKFAGLRPKEDIQAKLQRKHQQMLDIRQKISKITHFKASDLNFKSQIPQLQAKVNYLKQRIDRYVEEQAQKLGLNSDISLNFKLIQEHLTVPLERAQRRKIESVIEQLLIEQAEAEKFLEKYNTLQLFDNPEDETKIQTELKALNEELDELIEKRKTMYERIEGVKQDRRSILLSFISSIKPILSETYAILTEQPDGTTGKVDIFVENEEIPFESGMYFSPTPPSKRFIYDLQQLSGGEKSIASLALQYSLSLATKSYFLILDETDAFLDSANVDRFARLIQNSIRKSNIQFILITHKQGLFVNSLSLVGVARPKVAIGSQVYSLRLEDKMYMS